MNKKYIPTLLFLFVLLGFFSSSAQNNFVKTGVPPPAIQVIDEFDAVEFSSIAFADIDGDKDQDVLITGQSPHNKIWNTQLYKNNGSGSYTLVSGVFFEGVNEGSVAFTDIDGDQDQDVLITGNTFSGPISKLYSNDGTGNFTLIPNTPFDGVGKSSIAFADIDGDKDQDVLITGLDSSNTRISKLYNNNGSGSFSLDSSSSFEGVQNGSVAFADIDGDKDQDLLITGWASSNQPISNLYKNDSSGSFSLVPATPFDSVQYSSVAFSDIDADKDLDILITGYSSSGLISKLYSNDSLGNFTLIPNTPFIGVGRSAVAFTDIDGDNDEDVIISGKTSNGLISNLYSNDSLGNFTLIAGTSIDKTYNGSIAFSDIDGDNDQDILITGENSLGQIISKAYVNNGFGGFDLVSSTPFKGVYRGSVAFADIDGDKDQDVLITGLVEGVQFNAISNLYLNNGSGDFSLVSNTPFDSVFNSSVAFADIDGDNDQDVLITGMNSTGLRISKIYRNDSLGNFTLVTGTPFVGVDQGSIAFADIDGDNDQDVLITGNNSSNLYKNDGSGSFSLVSGTPFVNVYYSSVAFADIDGDNDQDVLITGDNGIPVSKLYINDSSGNFSLVSGTPFDGVKLGSVAFADIDGDKDQDVMITGLGYNNTKISKLYINDSVGNFSLVSGTPFNGIYNGSVAFADVDGDNDKDLLITGGINTSLYNNNGSGGFTVVPDTPFENKMSYSSIAFTDIDSDNDQDVLITGITSIYFPFIADLYENRNCQTGVPTSSSDTAIACNSYNWLGKTYTNSGTYMDTIPNTAACDSLMSLVLTINESPKSTTQANSCSPYVWRGSTYSTSGIYRDTIPNATGCDSIYILDISVYIIDTTITIGKHSLTSNDVGGNYQWGECKNGFQPIVGDTNQSFTPLYNGDFAVVVNKNNCSDTSACHTVLNVGMQENTFLKSAEIFPNPNNGTFEVSLGQKLKNASIKIINMEGKTVYSKNNQSSAKFNFDISDQAKGIYFLEIVQDKKVFRSRIVYN